MAKYNYDKKKIIKLLKANNIEHDTIDFASYSQDIPIEEWLFNEYGIIVKSLKEKIEDSKAALELQAIQEKEQLEKETEELKSRITAEEVKHVIRIEKLNIIRNLITSTIQSSDIHFCLVTGSGGLGKSYTALSTLQAAGLKSEVDYFELKSKTTPLSLYAFLYQHKDKVILLDDVMGIFDNEISLSILLSALWSSTKIRTVQYRTTSKVFEELGLTESFEFSGKIILLTNNVNFTNQFMAALRDRSFFYNLEFTYEEKLQFMGKLIEIEHEKLNFGQRKEVLNAIISLSSPATESFSFRTLLKAYSLRQFCEEWKEMLKVILPVDAAMLFVWQCIKDKISDGWKGFILEGFGSRATFFRMKKILMASVSQSQQKDISAVNAET